jgi:hypothetical protein
MEIQKTAVTGIGSLLAMITAERINVFLATVIGILTVAHLSIQIYRLLKKK